MELGSCSYVFTYSSQFMIENLFEMGRNAYSTFAVGSVKDEVLKNSTPRSTVTLDKSSLRALSSGTQWMLRVKVGMENDELNAWIRGVISDP